MDRRDDRESAPKNPLLMALQYSSASADTIVAEGMRDLEDLVADLANQVNATGCVLEQVLNRPVGAGAGNCSISREEREMMLFLVSETRCRVKALKERYYDAYNAGPSRQPDQPAAIEPAQIAQVDEDRLLELIKIYRRGLAADATDYCEAAHTASARAINEWTGPASTRESALAALDLAIAEGKEFSGSPTTEAMIRAAMLFIEAQPMRGGEN